MSTSMDVESDLDPAASFSLEGQSQEPVASHSVDFSVLAALPFSLLSTIKSAQAEHGLRHSDYLRYRYSYTRCCSLGIT